MAYVLMVIGTLMALLGFGVVGYSSLNARFDEFWTSLTVGATLVAGGVLTIALGFVTRVLLQLKTALLARPLEAATAAVAGPAMSPPAPEATAPRVEAPPRYNPAAPQPIPDKPRPARPFAPTPPEPIPASAPDMVGYGYAEEHAPPAALSGIDPARVGPAARTPPTHEPGTIDPVSVDTYPVDTYPVDTYPVETDPTDHVAEVPRHADDFKPETPNRPENDVGKVAPVETRPQEAAPQELTPKELAPRDTAPHEMAAREMAPPIYEDWLDRAFAEIDEDFPGKPLEQEKKTVTPAPIEAEPEPKVPELESAAAGPAHAGSDVAPAAAVSTAKPPPLETAPTSVVIGRYESEGTSYVMYDDGSIEAQSSSGVYRFSSMAELKAFIET